ncbi:MAG: hypothetical protein IPM56_17795 [Ignavibacteriales bacterium]|nr:MAG: hypothetical protein IPM56_17795 [Ignavibacteriales bacterium]
MVSNEASILSNDVDTLRNEAVILSNDVDILRNKADALNNEAHILRICGGSFDFVILRHI